MKNNEGKMCKLLRFTVYQISSSNSKNTPLENNGNISLQFVLVEFAVGNLYSC